MAIAGSASVAAASGIMARVAAWGDPDGDDDDEDTVDDDNEAEDDGDVDDQDEPIEEDEPDYNGPSEDDTVMAPTACRHGYDPRTCEYCVVFGRESPKPIPTRHSGWFRHKHQPIDHVPWALYVFLAGSVIGILFLVLYAIGHG